MLPVLHSGRIRHEDRTGVLVGDVEAGVVCRVSGHSALHLSDEFEKRATTTGCSDRRSETFDGLQCSLTGTVSSGQAAPRGAFRIAAVRHVLGTGKRPRR